MFKFLKRLMRCKVVMINFDEKPQTLRFDYLQPIAHYNKNSTDKACKKHI